MEGLATDYVSGSRIESHDHKRHQIVHASAGILRVTVSDGVWIVPPGRALWMPAHTVHGIHCLSAASMRTVYLRGDHELFSPRCTVWNVTPLLRELIVRVAEGSDQDQMPHLLALVLSEIRRVDSVTVYLPEPNDDRLKTITATYLVRPDDPRTLEQWAKELGLTPRTLIRRFQQQTGITFRQWRQQARLLASLESLAAGRSVTSAALEVGYDSPSAYIAVFRQVFGQSPGKYFMTETR